MEFRILGSMEVLDGTRRVELPTGKGRSLLAILTLHAGQEVASERLIDELWGEKPPTTAPTVVHGLVSRLRKMLEPGRSAGTRPQVLQTVGTAYRLAIDPYDVDANRFKRLLDEARGNSPEMRSEKLSAALSLWRGPALADFIYEPFAQRAIAALEESRIVAIEDRFEAELALGRDAELVAELHDVTATYPFRERLRGFLMVALYRAGRQAESLEAYRRTRALLLEEIGLEPGPELRELEAAILRQDPTLELRRTPRHEVRTRGEGDSWLPLERRTVTIAALDLAPSVGASLDTEAIARIGERAARVATEVLERHGARVERSLGDELIAFFGFPVAHEDDALSAVRAVLAARTAVHSLDGNRSLKHRWRAGIEAGEIIVAGPGAGLQDVGTRPAVSSARRLEEIAVDGDVLVGPAAQRLLRGAVILKAVDGGEGAPAKAWRVLEVVPHASAIPRAMDAPMIGREDELTRLRAAFRHALRSGGVVRVNVVGHAGIGKSRLVKEVLASLGADAHGITLRCPPPSEGLGFFPVRQGVIEAAGVHGWQKLHELLESADNGNSAVSEIAGASGLRSPPAAANELEAPMRRLLEVLAREHPMIVTVEDLHWADRNFTELVDRLERDVTGPILLLCLARPEPEDATGSMTGEVVSLKPLGASELAQLVLYRGGPVNQTSLQRIVNLSQGNPLFAEQLLATADDGNVDVIPPSLVGLLSMRLDRLGPGERDLLRCASIVGLDFDVALVRALLPGDARPFVERHLETLERKLLIEPAAPGRFRFAHALIQMTAYQSMTREDRARLHEALADPLEQDRSKSPGPPDSAGYHLRRALEHRRASRTLD